MTINNEQALASAEISRVTKWYVRPEELTKIKSDDESVRVFAVNKGKTTILCCLQADGTCIVKLQKW